MLTAPKYMDLASEALAAAKAPADPALAEKVLARAAAMLAESHGGAAPRVANGHANGAGPVTVINNVAAAPNGVAHAPKAKLIAKAKPKAAAKPAAKPLAKSTAKPTPKAKANKPDSKPVRKQAVLDAVKSGLATRAAITSKLGLQPQDVSVLLGDLKKEGAIIQCGDRGLTHYGMTKAIAEAAFAKTAASLKKNAPASAG